MKVKTTRGITIGVSDYEMSEHSAVVCFDVEGRDSIDSMNQVETFEMRFCTFTAAICNVVILNLQYASYSCATTNNYHILKEMFRIHCSNPSDIQRKVKLFFVYRNC